MTRSIFDPGNPHVERSGNAFTGPDPRNLSQMPEAAVDGVFGRDEIRPDDDVVGFDSQGQPIEPPPAPEGQFQMTGSLVDDLAYNQVDDGGGVDAAGHEPFANPEEPARRWPGE